MTPCPRCKGEKTLPTLSLIRGHWLPIANDPCPDCGGTGVQPEYICRFCGMYLHDANNGSYCSDVCQYKALQPITIDNTRFKIRATVDAPSGGWVYGKIVTIEQAGYLVDVWPGIGGAVLTRIRKKGASVESGLIRVERR